jgi:pimeloyl-ACP methyl ester carboxylesterase
MAVAAGFVPGRGRQAAGQDLAIKRCTAGGVFAPAECGTLVVYENRAARRGRRIGIHFVVVRGDWPGAREALFMFAGGPGQGSSVMAGAARGWAAAARVAQDVVFVDQRGTGGSHPLRCGAWADADPPSAFGHVFDPARVKQCRAALETDADLTQYTTESAVGDIDELRDRLGYEKVTLYGVSYGTRLAQAYLRRHPDRVRAVVLDGVVPFDEAVPLTYARSAQQSIDRVFAACEADPACHAAHPRPAGDLAFLERRLAAGPGQAMVRPRAGGARVRVAMSAGDFGYAVRGILYGGGAVVAELPGLLGRAAADGDFSEFAQRYFDRESAIEAGIALGVHLSVFCAEDVPFAADREIGEATSGTFLGRYLFDEYRGACAQWPRAPIPDDARAPVSARVPALLVSGFFDPVTPPRFAERVARSLPLSHLIVSPASGHGSAAGCPRAAVLHVLAGGALDGMPEVCR